MLEISNALKEALSEVLTMFGLEYTVFQEITEDRLKSSKEINVLLGLTGDLKGNILLGANKSTVLKIASAMMGGMEFPEVDDMVLSGISEFTNMVGGSATTKLSSMSLDISPPTVICSDGNTIIINTLKTVKTIFLINDEKLTISCSLKE